MPFIENLRYRPDVDGLRAIAVLAVVLYHADFRCPGGFVGVDVFFVISGFLITSIIWKDLESEKFTFAQFWERRARRIVPPLVVMTLAALLAGWFLLLPSDLISLGRAAASQSVFGANFNYWLELNYFTGSAREKPLLHTWSLAVEEQFYLIVPFLLWGIFRLRFSRRAVLSVLVTIFLVSFAISIYGVANYPSAAFYLLPFRAWELLMGSILAFLPVPNVRRSLRELLALAGMLLVIIPMFTYKTSTPFPGLAALAPCLGTAFLIWSNNAPTVASYVLSTRPVVFIGLISYSLYLWHWLFFSYARYIALEPYTLAFKWRVVLVGLSFIFAVLSWKYVETPFRKRKIASARKDVFAWAAAGLIAVFAGGAACLLLQGFPQRFSGKKLEYANAATDFEFKSDVSLEDARLEKLVPIGKPDASSPPVMLVWGDSHAMAAMPAFDAFLKEKGLSGRAVTHSATAPVVGWYLPNEAGLGKDSLAFADAVISYIRRQQIRDVVLVAHWSWSLDKDGFRPALLATIRQANDAGARVWILLDVPVPGFNVPRALSLFDYSEDYLRSLPPRQNEFGAEFISEIKSAGAVVLDPKPAFKGADGHYMIESGGVSLYIDGDHLTTTGAKMILLPLLRDSFAVNYP